MTTAEKILSDCSGDRGLQIYALSNALTITEALLGRAFRILDEAPVISQPSGLTDDECRAWFRERDTVIDELRAVLQPNREASSR